MNLGELMTMARTLVLEAKANVIGNTELQLILNDGAVEVASRSLCLKTNDKIPTVADQAEYDLTAQLDRYLVMDKPGVWYRNTTSEEYQRLIPRTMKYMDEHKPAWRDLDGDRPEEYIIHGDELILVPAPATAITEAIWIYYGQAPQTMTDEEEHYPFGFTTEIHRLKPLQQAILAYWRWRAAMALNKGIQIEDALEARFERELSKQVSLVDRRKDIVNSRQSKTKPKRWM